MAYQGLFLRHYMGDDPTKPPQVSSDSPDIILEGQDPVDPATLTTQQSYITEPPDTLWVGSNLTNYIYVRGLNATTGPLTARLWLWYAEPNILLWPQQWVSDGFYVGGTKKNWQNVTAASPNQIVATDAYTVVSPATPQDHYCMVAIAENPPLSEPAYAPFPGAFTNLTEFTVWIQNNPNAAWRNTIDKATTAAQWNWVAPIAGPDDGGQPTLGVLCSNMPVGSQFRYVVPPGRTAKGDPYPGVDSGIRTVQNPNDQSGIQVTWPPAVTTGMSLTWWANGTTVTSGALITPYVGSFASSLEGIVDDPQRGAVELTIYEDLQDESSARQVHMHMLGGQPIRFKG
jgi:hypothetical protein